MIRKILFIFVAAGSLAHASVTKVGNGDDGADLEALKPITSGPIFAARAEAVGRLRNLNVIGVAGLGMLTPELERSDMMMATANVHPTGEVAGALEISPDRTEVYARTFAEPYAATRFFPAAEKLTREQLVALHIHEALHRSLPLAVRENEDVVMHITMALTSPGASFDRVRQVASLYIKPVPVTTMEETQAIAARVPPKALSPLPPDSKSKFGVQVENFQPGQGIRQGYEGYSQGLEFATSLGGYKRIGSLALEPYFRARMKILAPPGVVTSQIGPSAFDFAARMRSEEGHISSLFARFTAKSLDRFSRYEFDRDIWTFGIMHQRNGYRGYLESQVFYSLASTAARFYESNQYLYRSGSKIYSPVLSFAVNGGWNFKKWRLGGLAELHASNGNTFDGEYGVYEDGDAGRASYYRVTSKSDPFRILALGPEFGYHGESFQMKIYAKQIVNDGVFGFSDLGDIVDRGAGRSVLGATLAAAF